MRVWSWLASPRIGYWASANGSALRPKAPCPSFSRRESTPSVSDVRASSRPRAVSAPYASGLAPAPTIPTPVTVSGRTSGKISSGTVARASPDLSSSTPRRTSRPGRRLTTNQPAESVSCCSPTEDASASGPTGSAPVALTVT